MRRKWFTGAGRTKKPAYYVFFNGKDQYPDRTELRLSDAFNTDKDISGFEWTAVMLNINEGHNRELMSKCRALDDYSRFVSCVKKKAAEFKDSGAAIRETVSLFKQGDGTLAKILTAHEAEVIDVCITEYDEAQTMQAIKEESEKKGRLEGENRLGKLIIQLTQEGKTDMIIKVSTDENIRNQLYKKYNIN